MYAPLSFAMSGGGYFKAMSEEKHHTQFTLAFLGAIILIIFIFHEAIYHWLMRGVK